MMTLKMRNFKWKYRGIGVVWGIEEHLYKISRLSLDQLDGTRSTHNGQASYSYQQEVDEN